MAKDNRLKKRNWACVVYPESAPQNWQEILQKTGLQCAVSPLHEGELNADESEKKEHWHVIMCWEGPTTQSVALGVTAKLNAPPPIPLESLRGYYRYLTHADNPEKKQYDTKDIVCLNGFSITDFVELTRSEVDETLTSLIRMVKEMNFYEYAELLDYLDDNDFSTEKNVAYRNTILLNTYIKSRRHKAHIIETSASQAATLDRFRSENEALRSKVRE